MSTDDDFRSFQADTEAYRIRVEAELADIRKRFFRAQSAVHQYMVALGPHMSDSWKEFLAKECGLEIDEGSPYRHPKPPKGPKP